MKRRAGTLGAVVVSQASITERTGAGGACRKDAEHCERREGESCRKTMWARHGRTFKGESRKRMRRRLSSEQPHSPRRRCKRA